MACVPKLVLCIQIVKIVHVFCSGLSTIVIKPVIISVIIIVINMNGGVKN